ncbi:MAG: hypothetical protein KG003_15155 [Bacteroidetes bacterium]|nr:hypothetical protein [Bacteroidota bacterium]
MRTIEILPESDFSVLKVIQVEGPKWNWFTGYLPYLRVFNPKVYDSHKGDFLDEKIFEIVKQTLPNSFLRFSEEILFQGQLDDRLRTLEGGSRKSVTIQFFPLIPHELVPTMINRQFLAYPMGFDMRLLFKEGSEKKHNIIDFFLCNLPFDKIDDLVKTIKPI